MAGPKADGPALRSGQLAASAYTAPAVALPRPIFGVLQATPERLASEYRAGLRLAVLELAWDRYEPQAGKFSAVYAAKVRERMNIYRNAGMRVMLDFGMQYPPAWIFREGASRFVNQYGQAYTNPAPGGNGVDAVFNQAIRRFQTAYVRQVFRNLGTGFYAVRLGWGQDGELGYPPARKYHGRCNCYWCFGPIAQGKTKGLPDSLKPCPVPGWIPGSPSPEPLAASRFADWYMGCLENYQNWQICLVRRYYGGRLAVLYPSWGVRPGQLNAAIAGNLAGRTSTEINGEIQRGLDFRRLINGIHGPQVTVYCTWLDAPLRLCKDRSRDRARWSPIHYLAFLAAHHQPRLAVWGENTGHPDDLADMHLCFQRLRTYHLIGMLWAFQRNLFAAGSMATLHAYGQAIARVRGNPH